jgi:aminoglycoside phosphotransferase (APT) family kinase protein
LARLHGPTWDDPALDKVDWLTRRSGPDDTAQLVGLWQVLYPGFVETYRPYLSDETFELVAWFGGHLAEWVDHVDGPSTVTHGDYRLDNLLFGVADTAPPVAVVDWQTPGHGRPVGDLSYFLGAGLIPDERRRHERELLATYQVALHEYGVDLDDAWLWREYCHAAFGGVVMAVIASQIVGLNARSEAMFAAMATRHSQHALDVGARDLI